MRMLVPSRPRFIAVVVGVASLALVSASRADVRSARKCRASIGKLAKVAIKGLEAVDACQADANEHCDSGTQCLVLPSLDTKGKYGDAKAKAAAAIQEKCAGERLVAENYATGMVESTLFPIIDAAVEGHLASAPPGRLFACDRGKRRCFETIAR